MDTCFEFDFLSATEAAAIAVFPWLGKGEKEKADKEASDAIRQVLQSVAISGECIIGEGIKDEAPGIFKGEKLGTWSAGSPRVEIAVDPVDGTTNASKGKSNAISCLAAVCPEEQGAPALMDIPCFYSKKLAYGPQVAQAVKEGRIAIDVHTSLSETLSQVAEVLGKRIEEVTVVVLERSRHEKMISEIRRVGAALRMIGDGDIAAALAPCLPHIGVDLYVGIGGSPEGVLSAVGIHCLGGDMQLSWWPQDEREKQALIDTGYGEQIDKTFFAQDLARGKSMVFCATGITDSPLLRGVQYRKEHVEISSLLISNRDPSACFVNAQRFEGVRN